MLALRADAKKKILREYLKKAGYYSYNAAADDEDPVTRWIGREAKRFLSEAHIHLPYLLQLAAAPPEECTDGLPDATGAKFSPFLHQICVLMLDCLPRRRQ